MSANFRMNGTPENTWLPGKQPPTVIESTPFWAPPTSQDVLAVGVGTPYCGSRLVNPGQVTYARRRGDLGLTFLADIRHGVPYAGYVTVSVLHRNGDVGASCHCTECGASEGELHRGGEKCVGLQRMRAHHGLNPIEAGHSCLDAVKETRLRPYKSELAVMMVDDQSEPP